MGTACSTGLYAPAFERDSCGFGLVADIDDRPGRALVDSALTALGRLAHRGAVGGDGLSGDGCGLLIRRPEAFLRNLADEAGIKIGGLFAVGCVFLADAQDRADVQRATLAEALAAQGLRVAGWRTVPVCRAACGPIALAGLPRIEQVLVAVDRPLAPEDLQRTLFLARRCAERSLARDDGFYVVTLSADTLGDKAMVLPEALAAVYPDLQRPDLASSVVLFHQRFSTNTAPRRHAAPFPETVPAQPRGTAVYPYLAYQTLAALGRDGALEGKRGNAPTELGRSYRRGLQKGPLKILSKMGISTIGSYRGAQLFEIVGVADEVVALCFPGIPSRLQGAGFADLEADSRPLSVRAWSELEDIEPGGRLKYVHGGETHMFNPDVIASLQLCVRSGEFADYRAYAELVDGRPASTLRDLLSLRADVQPIPITSVEPSEAILTRFDSAGMSLGALSPEAHEALATAMNRLGGRSNSGRARRAVAR